MHLPPLDAPSNTNTHTHNPFHMPFRSSVRRTAHLTRARILRRKVNVTLNLTDYSAILAHAQAGSRSVSRTLASLAKAQLDAQPLLTEADRLALADLTRQVRAIGTHLNQIAHACRLQANAGKIPQAAHCLEFLQKLHHQLELIERAYPRKPI